MCHDTPTLSADRKLLTGGLVPQAVCCLIDNRGGDRPECNQVKPNQQSGKVRQEGLVNVQGVFGEYQQLLVTEVLRLFPVLHMYRLVWPQWRVAWPLDCVPPDKQHAAHVSLFAVNVGCIQVLADVNACVAVGSVIGPGYCLSNLLI